MTYLPVAEIAVAMARKLRVEYPGAIYHLINRGDRREDVFLDGHLFSGRYKSLVVDGSGRGYLKSVCDYVHLNPVRARILKEEQRLRDFRWTSFPEYLKAARKRPNWPEWIGCWVDGAFCGIPVLSGVGSNEAWRGGKSKSPKQRISSGKNCAEGGAGANRPFGSSCWSSLERSRLSTIAGKR